MRIDRASLAAWLIAAAPTAAAGGEPPSAATSPDPQAPVSFVGDVAPILRKHCVGCHNPKRAEGRYDLTTYSALAAGPQGGEAAIVPGDPDSSLLVELIGEGGEPRMPYKQPPLSAEKAATIGRWIAQGAKYDGGRPDEDWLALLRKRDRASIPDEYPAAVPIASLAFLPDGSTLLASGYREVNAWDAGKGALGQRLRGVAQRVHDIAVSPDGRWLATASGDPGLLGTTRLSRIEGGKVEEGRELDEAQDGVFAVAFSPDSRLIASAGADRVIRIWEVESAKLVTSIEDHADWILALAFSPDGKRIATASRDKTSKVFDVATKDTIATFPGHADTVYAVAFAPDGKKIATGGGDGQVRIWTPDDDAKQVRSLTGFGGAVFQVAYNADGSELFASSADGVVRAFRDEKKRLELRGHSDWVYSLAISPDGGRLASGSWDGEVRIWDLADGKSLLDFRALPGRGPIARATPAGH